MRLTFKTVLCLSLSWLCLIHTWAQRGWGGGRSGCGLRATLKQATQERADFAKGLVSVKEYKAHTERLRVEQDKIKVEREWKKRKDLQGVWASPVFDSPRALEGCASSRAPAPSDAFATPPDNNINVCFLLQPRLWAGSATACWRGASVWQIVWLLFLSGSLHCLIAKWHSSPSPLVQVMSPADLNKLLLELLK